jgi:hypothetical protein
MSKKIAYIQVRVEIDADPGLHVRVGKVAATELVKCIKKVSPDGKIMEGRDLIAGDYAVTIKGAEFTKSVSEEVEEADPLDADPPPSTKE